MILLNNCFDGIVLDSSLPDGAGSDFVEFIEEKYKEYGAPIISMSGYSVEKQKSFYAGMKIYAFLEKPVSKAEIIRIVEELPVKKETG